MQPQHEKDEDANDLIHPILLRADFASQLQDYSSQHHSHEDPGRQSEKLIPLGIAPIPRNGKDVGHEKHGQHGADALATAEGFGQ